MDLIDNINSNNQQLFNERKRQECDIWPKTKSARPPAAPFTMMLAMII